MTRLERYIFRQAAGAFLLCLGAVTALVWVTQALRRLDIVTAQGETLWAFLTVTLLMIPQLAVIMSPIALFVAVVWLLNRLNADSELIVMAAAGVSLRRICRPFVALALLVTLASGAVSLFVMPASLAMMRILVSKIYGDVISSMAQGGTFTEFDNGLTFHMREREPDGTLKGLLVSDQRDPKEPATYLADTARVAELLTGTFLVMQNGTIQRRRPEQPEEVTFIAFDAYALDLSTLMPKDEAVVFSPRERSTYELLFPNTNDQYYGLLEPKIRAELHDRLVAPLYVLPFALIALAVLGQPRTNRQSRLSAIGSAVALVCLARGLGFSAMSMLQRSPGAVVLVYAIPVVATLASVSIVLLGDRMALSRLGVGRLGPAARALASRIALRPAGSGAAT